MEFIEVLDLLKSQVLDLQDQKYNRKANIILGFFIYVEYYNKKIDFEKFNNANSDDIKYDNSEEENLYSDIYDSLKNDLHDRSLFVEKIYNSVKEQNLNRYSSIHNNQLLDEWCVDHLFFNYDGFLSLRPPINDLFFLMNNVKNNALKLPDKLNDPHSNVLISRIGSSIFLKRIFKEKKKASICFYGISPSHYLEFRILSLFASLYSNYTCIMENNNEESKGSQSKMDIYPSNQEKSFDFIIADIYNASRSSISDLMHFLKPSGHCIAFGLRQIKDDLSEEFYKYQIPFLVFYYEYPSYGGDGLAIICKKEEDSSKIVFAAECTISDGGISLNEHECIEAITTEKTTDHIIRLSKEDFKYSENNDLSFDNLKIKRHDKLNYIWKNKDEVLIPYFSKECIHEDIDLDKIVDDNVLRKIKPYEYKLPKEYFISTPNCGYLGENKYVKEFGIDLQEKPGRQVQRIPDEYESQMLSILKIEGELTDEIKQFETKICCRFLTTPLWITNLGRDRILKVNASKKKPVCYRALKFYYDPVEGYLEDYSSIIPVTIADDCDPDYIAYILPDYKQQGGLLVPPSKEEQHKEYLRAKEQEEARLMDEIETNQKRLGIPSIQKKLDVALKNIKKAADLRNSLEYQIRKDYKIELDAAKNLGDTFEEEIYQRLTSHFKNEQSKPSRHLNPLRIIIEKMYNKGVKEKIFPPSLSLNGFGKLLNHQQNVESYELLHPNDFVSHAQGFAFNFLLQCTQGGSHADTDITEFLEKNKNSNLSVGLLFITLDLLKWYSDLVNKYEDPSFPEFKEGKIWKKASKLEHVKVEERRQGERTTYVATFGDETYELKQKKAERKLSNGDFVTIISYNKHKFSKDITYFCGEHDYEIEKK